MVVAVMTDRLGAARGFMAGNARLLDRRRFELLFDDGDPEPALAALRAYRNPDGGYGHGLEPDLRSRSRSPPGMRSRCSPTSRRSSHPKRHSSATTSRR
jgi:hypothetical protein